jgi:hypothetical protein
MQARRFVALLASVVFLAIPLQSSGQNAAAAQAEPQSAAGWIARAADIADQLKQAEVVRMEDVGTGVTNPKRAYVAPGGAFDSFVWKPLTPGRYRGYWESYTAEIAAYELDMLLGLHMVPVTVERRIRGDRGSAKVWLEPVKSFSEMGGLPTPPPTHIGMWNLQLIRAKMFDNLIYNMDPNLGNWLVDPSWNIFLIDHSRAFTDGKKLVHEMTRIDRDLWDRMAQLDEATLTGALGVWLNEREIRAILARRDLMAEAIRKRVDDQGEADVFVRGGTLGAETVRPSVETDTGSFAQRAAKAVDAPLFLPPASALLWMGEVVRLADYEGAHLEKARLAVQSGHTLGLLTADGLFVLAPNPQDAGPHTGLESSIGGQVSVFGPATADDQLVIVQVMRSAPAR